MVYSSLPVGLVKAVSSNSVNSPQNLLFTDFVMTYVIYVSLLYDFGVAFLINLQPYCNVIVKNFVSLC